MSNEITRMFADAAAAASAADELREEGFDDIFVVNPAPAGTPESAIAAQIALGRVWLPHAKIYAKGVAAGHALVTVHAPFGSGVVAENILDSHGPVDSGLPQEAPPPMWDEAAPLSSTLNLPVLIDDPDPVSRVLGISAVTEGNCSVTGSFMPLLTSGDMGERGRLGFSYLIDNPTWLSSKLGLRVLSRRQ